MQNERDVKRPHLDLLPVILSRYPDIQAVYLEGVEKGTAATGERGRGGKGGALRPLRHACQLSSPALPAGVSVCSSGTAEGTAPRLFFHTLYPYGSAAEGKEGADSDIDLASLPRSRELRKRRLDIGADLARAGFGRVGLLILDVDDNVVKFEAVRQNRIIYQAEDLERGAFYSRIVRQYWDFLPCLAIQRRALKRRLFDGQS